MGCGALGATRSKLDLSCGARVSGVIPGLFFCSDPILSVRPSVKKRLADSPAARLCDLRLGSFLGRIFVP